ncbi:MAG: DUF1295 domain-containing protein [Clostridia bacterium]|nr:DUF1295 domain-containing protein [Clostridia bacterium]
MKKNKVFSYAMILLVYAFALLVGVAIYLSLFDELKMWLALLIADTGATVLVFIFSLIFKNASVYDPYWSVAPIFILGLLLIGQALTPLKLVLFIIVTIWGVRLTANWAYCFGDLTCQDWRYTMLKEQTGKFYPVINLVGIHLVPTLVVYSCILPACFVITSNSLNEHPMAYALLGVSLLAVALQGTADYQMQRYRKNKTSRFIRVGLWKYSRHPNYLGEILMWWGVGGACAIANPSMWFLLLGALINTMLFAFVSIPMAEKRQAKKEGFLEYKKETNYLLPIKIKK